MSVARLWCDQVKRDEAPPQVRGWFTEGFETLGLKEAKIARRAGVMTAFWGSEEAGLEKAASGAPPPPSKTSNDRFPSNCDVRCPMGNVRSTCAP